MHLDLDLYRNDYNLKIWFFIWSSRVRCQTWGNKRQVWGVNTSKTLVRLKTLRFLWNLTRSLLNFGSEIVFWAFLGKLPAPIKSFKLYLDIYDNHKSLKGGLSDKKKKKHRWRRNLRRTMSVGEIIMRSRWSCWKNISEGFTCTDVASRLVIRATVAARELSFKAKGDVCDPSSNSRVMQCEFSWKQMRSNFNFTLVF